MRKGFRQQPGETGKKAAIKELQVALSNLQMGFRINQMVAQQQMQTISRLDGDMRRVFGVGQNLDYRTRALLELLNVDDDKLNEIADRMRLEDFNRQSDEEDKKLGFTNDDAGVVTENSIVILTSTTGQEPDTGIFRTKFSVNEAPLPTFKDKLVGKKVGEQFTDTVNGVEHTFTVVGLRLAPPKAEAAPEKVGLSVVAENAAEATQQE